MNKPLEIALGEYGVSGIIGPQDNPQIVKYFAETGSAWVQDDETAWCSAFMNWVMMKAGLPYTKKLNARSWLDLGTAVITPQIGDIVILWRVSKNSAYGHVGLFIKEDADGVFILGGNQNNSVCIKEFPKYQLLGYRRIS